MRRLVAALAACLGAASPSFAESPTSGFVRLHAIDLLERALTQEQQTKLQLVAYQTAIADVCLGFTLDDAKMGKAFEALAPADAAKMSDAQKDYHDKHILVIYGILVGGELAALSDDPSEACAAAEKVKADPDFADQVVWQ
ncbi:hypothetical protein [Rhizobium grahamii]|uniref:Uncharacterized protein n=1 Tax=Rhizobium grahamii CCGE 502 TaxID=990285 RepID=S3HR69_9HYPH|nr:hypothetical protein [Rhizobium grahamii]EPE95751.1 hypothetical protein RGCCGE502_22915 [Rhizobium grahamii CCGE 502]